MIHPEEGFLGFDELHEAYRHESADVGQQYVPPAKDNDGFVERAVTINRPLGEVYRFWRQISNFPLFMKFVVSVTETDARHSHWMVKGPGGQTFEWDAEIVEDIPDKIISWRSLPNSDVENSGQIRFAAGPKGAEVRLRMRYHIPGGKVADKLATFFSGDPQEQVRENLWRFKQLLEAGEIATLNGQSKGGNS